MNTIILAIILGVIEGITEFIPVSSTGHLIIANKFMDFNGAFANFFAIAIQSGAIFAAMIYFREKVLPPITSQKSMKAYFSLWFKVAFALIPAVIVAFTLEDIIDKYLFNPITVAIALIVGGFLLIIMESRDHASNIETDEQITYKNAFIVGIFQTLAILLPGMSRSASTIIGGLFVGYSRKLAAEFSFYLAMPALLGAAVYKMISYSGEILPDEWQMLWIGTLVSFIVAYAVIAFFMNYIRKHDMKIFAYYRIILGIIVIIMYNL